MRRWFWPRIERQLRMAVPPDRVGAVLAELLDDYVDKERLTGSFRAILWLLIESRSLVKAYQRQNGAAAVRISSWCQSVAQDLAYALRSLRRQPTFALVPMGALAIAIGIAVSLFTVFSAVILRPWPVKDPARVVAVLAETPDGRGGFSAPEYRYLADHVTTFAGLTARGFVTRAYVGDEAVESPTNGMSVSRNFFDVMGVRMALGRAFTTDDDRSDASQAVVVLNYRFWQSRFAASPGILGAPVLLNGVPFTVIGVATSTFPSLEGAAENFWIPLSAAPLLDVDVTRWLKDPHVNYLEVAGRLNPDVTRAQAGAELETLSRQFRSPLAIPPQRLRLAGTTFTERPTSKRQVLPILGLMGLGVLLMLVIACANVGNLLLARGAARAREMGVRLSVGASRARLVRQLLTESLVLAVGAGAIGTTLAYGLPDAMFTLAGEPPPFPIVPDLSVLVFALLLTLLVCVGAGLAPAIYGTGKDVVSALKEGIGIGGMHLRTRRLLLAVQVAVSVCLLAGAALSARSVQNAEVLNADFAVRNISVISFATPSHSNQGFGPAFFVALTASVQGLHVPVFGLAAVPPLSGSSRTATVRLADNRRGQQRVTIEDVSAGYFEVLRIPMVAGRTFVPADAQGAVALINELLARSDWQGADPVGATVYVSDKAYEIVGVVKDVHTSQLDHIDPVIYRPFVGGSRAALLVPAELPTAVAVARVIHELRPEVHAQIEPLQDALASALAPSRTGAALAGFLGVFALALATIGMWGVFGYVVELRTREIGIRMTLGATPGQVVRLVLAGNSLALLVGFAVGLMGAAAAARLLQSHLYGVSAFDVPAFGSVIGILAAAAIVASYGPARRASRVSPSAALRTP
jgi:predicted permease